MLPFVVACAFCLSSVFAKGPYTALNCTGAGKEPPDTNWGLAAQIDGSKSTWLYNAAVWTQSAAFGSPNDPLAEKKTSLFSSSKGPFKLRMQFLNREIREIYIPAQGKSLQEIFAAGTFVPFNSFLHRDCWRKWLIPEGSYQPNCNVYGFNAQTGVKNARIGIVFNQENDCGTPDVVLGVGTTQVSAGEYVGCCASETYVRPEGNNGIRFATAWILAAQPSQQGTFRAVMTSRYWDALNGITSAQSAKTAFRGANDAVLSGYPGFCEYTKLNSGSAFNHPSLCENGAKINLALLIRTVVNVSVSGDYTFFWGVDSKYTAFFLNNQDLSSFSSSMYSYEGNLDASRMHSVKAYLEVGKLYALEAYGFLTHGGGKKQDFAVAYSGGQMDVMQAQVSLGNGVSVYFFEPEPVLGSLNPSSGHTNGGYAMTISGNFMAHPPSSMKKRRGVNAAFYNFPWSGVPQEWWHYNNIMSTGCETILPNVEGEWQTEKTVVNCRDGQVKNTFDQNFYVVYYGYLYVPSSGTWAFRLGSDDGMSFAFNHDQNQVRDWSLHAYKQKTGASFTVNSAGVYPFRISFFERGGHAIAKLFWKPPGTSEFVIVPGENFFLDPWGIDEDLISCPIPANFCPSPGEQFFRDCDGDGVPDHGCRQSFPNLTVLSSKNNCAAQNRCGTLTAKMGKANLAVLDIAEEEMLTQVPAGQAESYSPNNVGVAVTSMTGTSNVLAFAYDAPVISLIQPDFIPTAGGTITLNGKNLGISPALVCGSSNAVSGQTTPATDGSGASSAVFTLGAGNGGTISCTLKVGTQEVGLSATYATPTISGVTPQNLPTEQRNTKLTISGLNLGLNLNITIGKYQMSCAQSNAAHTQAECVFPFDAQGDNMAVVANVKGTEYAQPVVYSFKKPLITSTSAQLIGTQGALYTLTLTGSSFGADPSVLFWSRRQSPDWPVQIAVNHTKVTFTGVNFYGGGYRLYLKCGGLLSSNYGYASLFNPNITSIEAKPPVTSDGGKLTIRGTDFGFSISVFFPTITTVTAETFSWNSVPRTVTSGNPSQVIVTLPPGHFGQKTHNVTVDYYRYVSNYAAVPAIFPNDLYAPPVVSSASSLPTPSLLPTAGGLLVQVSGTNFGMSGRGTVRIGGNRCGIGDTGTFWGPKKIVCTSPAGYGKKQVVKVVLEGGIESEEVTPVELDYADPAVTKITPVSGETVGGTTVVIQGSNFGSGTNSFVPCAADFSKQAPGGLGRDYVCPSEKPFCRGFTSPATYGTCVGFVVFSLDQATNSCAACKFTLVPRVWEDDSIQVDVPAGQGQNWEFQVVAPSGNVTAANMFSYDGPTVVALANITTLGSTAGGTNLTVTGTNFGTAQQTRLLVLNESTPLWDTRASVVSADRQTAVFVSKAGTGSVNITVEVLGEQLNPSVQRAAQVRSYRYDLPVVSSVRSTTCTSQGQGVIDCPINQNVITLIGDNFGTSGQAVDFIVNDAGGSKLSCSVTSSTHKQIVCTLPANPRGGFLVTIVVTVSGLSSAPVDGLFAWKGASIELKNSASLPNAKPGDSLNLVSGEACLSNTPQQNEIRIGLKSDDFASKQIITGCTVTCPTDIACKVPKAVGGNLRIQARFGAPGQDLLSSHSKSTVSYAKVNILSYSLRDRVNATVSPDAQGRYGTGTLRQKKRISEISFNIENWFTPDDKEGRFAANMLVTYDDKAAVNKTTYECNNAEVHVINATVQRIDCETSPPIYSPADFFFKVHAWPSESVRHQISDYSSDYLRLPKPPFIGNVSSSGCDADGKGIKNCPTLGGYDITILGDAFTNSKPEVTIGGLQCVVRENSDTRLVCVTPPGAGSNVPIVVSTQELYSQPTELFSYAPPDTKKLTWKWTVVQGQLFDQKQFTIPGSEKNSLVECMKDCEAQAACDSVSLKPGLFGQDKCSLMTVGTSTPNVAPLPSSPLFQLKRNQNDIPSSNNCQLAGSTALQECPRSGGAEIQLVGEHFGPSTPEVLVCELKCVGVQILIPHRLVSCQLPIGTAVDNDVALIQGGGNIAKKPWPKLAYTQCVAGKYGSTGSNTTCFDCQAGKFTSQEGLLECDLCPLGKFSSLGKSACENCAPGRFGDKFGMSDCKDCSPGRFGFTEGASTCQNCALGTATNTPRSQSCQQCALGTFSSAEGSTVCRKCSAGQYPTRDASGCNACDVGKFSSSPGSSTCTDCLAGTYSEASTNPEIGATKCIKCSTGQFQPLPQQGDCDDCIAGRFTNTSGQSSCTSCSLGRASAIRSSQCVDCIAGSAAPFSGTGPTCSECGVGTFSSQPAATVCSQCPIGKFNNVANQTICQDCPVGRANSNLGKIECAGCDQGFYSNTTGLTVCVECAPGHFQKDRRQTKCDECLPGTFMASRRAAKCDPCIAGRTTTKAGASWCDLCSIGRFSGVDGSSSCAACPAGKYQDAEGQAKCKECALGYFTNRTGQTICSACPAGSFAGKQGSLECTPCKPGTFSVFSATVQCSKCSTGSYAKTDGSQQCDPCPAGRFQDSEGGVQCNQCPRGRFTGYQGVESCDKCPVGRVSSTLGSSACTDCAAGSFQDESGQSVCALCKVGQFQASSKGTGCNECEVGTFANSTGQALCSDCPGGRAQDQQGAATCNICPPGKRAPKKSEFCKACENTKVAVDEGSEICANCPKGAVSNPEHTACLCPVGFAGVVKASRTRPPIVATLPPSTLQPTVSPTLPPSPFVNKNLTNSPTFAGSSPDQNGTNSPTQQVIAPTNYPTLVPTSAPTPEEEEGAIGLECVKCDPCFVCDQKGLNWEDLATKPGWYAQDQKCEACLLPSSCPGGKPYKGEKLKEELKDDGAVPATLRSKSPCGENRMGVLCALCKPDSSKSVGGVCTKCGTKEANITLLVFVSVGSVVALLFLYGVMLNNGKKLIHSALIEDELLRRQAKGFDVDDTLAAHDLYRHQALVTIFGAPAPKPDFKFKLKIALGFVQILTNLMIGLDISWPRQFKDFIQYFNFANLDFFAGASVSCIVTTTYYHKLWAMVAVPFVGTLILYCAFLLPLYCANCKSRTNRKGARQQFWSLVMFTLFLVYPTCSSVILRLYQCKTVYGQTYLRADFSIQCTATNALGEVNESFSTWQTHALLAIPAVVLIPIGIPLFMFWMIYRYRFRLSELGIRAELGFLYDAYERTSWYWEMADMGHKLCIVALVAFIHNKQAQIAAACFVALLYMVAMLARKPYLRKADDRVHQFAQTEIILCLLSAYWLGGLEEGMTNSEEVFLSIILIAIILLFFFFALVGVVYSMWKVFMAHQCGLRLSAWCAMKSENSCCASQVKKKKAKKSAARRGDGRLKDVGEEFFDGVYNLEFVAQRHAIAHKDTRDDDDFVNQMERNPAMEIENDTDMVNAGHSLHDSVEFDQKTMDYVMKQTE